ncbi:hypothetical protein SADUNF_Sadunf15G0032000 [Salix dunnii]|uniref:Retrotransposon Copia-like N-terminal domain-containing protein n=1 Tax=Salix dunnii TaxID=1413687 RepID=A0A835MS20_9ROSI|nr:hypothetical protein SADUNF_Sadunf15G0032000 [Salix dunnii]
MTNTPKYGESSNLDMPKLIFEMSKLSSPSFPSHPLATSFNISSLFTIPMDCTNYLSWKSQFEDILEMHGLTVVVKNNTKPPKLQEDGFVHLELAGSKQLPHPRSKHFSSHVPLLIKLGICWPNVSHLLPAPIYVLDGLGLEYKELATTLHLHPDIDFDQFYDLAVREEHLQKRMSLTLTTGVAMAADRVPNEHSFNSRLPSPNYNPNHRFGRGRGRNWNQGHGSGRGPRRTGQWEPTQGAWTPDRHSQPHDP